MPATNKVRGIRVEEANTMTESKAGIDPKQLEILVCPITKGPLEYDAAAQELLSRQAQRA